MIYIYIYIYIYRFHKLNFKDLVGYYCIAMHYQKILWDYFQDSNSYNPRKQQNLKLFAIQ